MQRKETDRICAVPSCMEILKKNESGLCKGCDEVVEYMEGDPWIPG